MWGANRIAGAAGLVLAGMLSAAIGLDFVIIATTGGPPVIGLGTLSADLERVRASAIWPVEGWLYVLQIVPFSIFVAGLGSVYRDSESGDVARMAVVAGLLFMVLHTLHNLAIVTVVQVMAPDYSPSAANAGAIEAASRAVLGFSYAAFLPGGGVGSLLLVLSTVGFAIVQGRTRRLGSAWSAPLAWATAAFVAAGYLQYVVAPAFVLALVGFFAFVGWITSASLSLLRAAPQPATISLAPA
jgi:hypothetical protein